MAFLVNHSQDCFKSINCPHAAFNKFINIILANLIFTGFKSVLHQIKLIHSK
jgi:hypothetical protein